MTIQTDSYTSTQVSEIVGFPLRKLISFTERGYVTPSIQNSSGHGSRRLWSFSDIVRCMAIVYLLPATSVEVIRWFASFWDHDSAIGPDCIWLLQLNSTTTDNRPYLPPTIIRESDKWIQTLQVDGNEHKIDLKKNIISTHAAVIINFKTLHASAERRISTM